MPAALKGLLEQTFRPGFAFGAGDSKGLPPKLLKGRSARIIVTMGMPAFFYRWYFRAHSLKALERNILAFVGFGPIRSTVIGAVATKDATKRAAWLERVRRSGQKAS
jgi:putative NADPH-quinone reductase